MSQDPEVMPDEQVDRSTGEIVSRQTELSATTLAAEAEAIVKAKFAIAQARPRDIDMARSRILKACKRPLFARSARYSVPRGSTRIEGPSIRFAEEAIRGMGNIDVSVRTIFEDDERRKVRVDCTDLESNTGYSAEAVIAKTIERRKISEKQTPIAIRKNSYGDTVYIVPATEDEMLTKTNALVSKAMRTQGLRLVPGDIVEEAMALCIATAKDDEAKNPDEARRRVLDGFDAIGVPPSDLKKHLGVDPSTLSPDEIEKLRFLYEAIRSGETTWRAIVAEKAEGGGSEKATKASPAKAAAAKAAKGESE